MVTGARLEYAGQEFELWIQRDRWFLYRSGFNGTSFINFIIIKADRKPRLEENGQWYGLQEPRPGVNLCEFYANQWVAREKLIKLARGETQVMTYRAQDQARSKDKKAPMDLPALTRRSLGDVPRQQLFRVINIEQRLIARRSKLGPPTSLLRMRPGDRNDAASIIMDD
jgi:hypothetical protein